LLRQKIPLKIVLLLLQSSPLKHKDLQEKLELAPSTLTYHLNKLLKDNIIDLQTHGEDKGYHITDKKLVLMYLTKYKLHTMVEGMSDIWDDISYTI
jgi:DNA-binding transcriptional ArsR family regulator